MVLQQKYQVTGLFSMAHADYPVICSHRLPREHASLKAASKEIEAFQLFLWPEGKKKKKFRQFSTWMDHFQILMTHFGPRIWISEENFGLWNRILVSHPRPPSWPLYRDEGPTFSHMPKWNKFHVSHNSSMDNACTTLVTRRKNIFLYFFIELKIYHLSHFYLQTLRYRHCWS